MCVQWGEGVCVCAYTCMFVCECVCVCARMCVCKTWTFGMILCSLALTWSFKSFIWNRIYFHTGKISATCIGYDPHKQLHDAVKLPNAEPLRTHNPDTFWYTFIFLAFMRFFSLLKWVLAHVWVFTEYFTYIFTYGFMNVFCVFPLCQLSGWRQVV